MSELITYYLEMNQSQALRAKPLPAGLTVVECAQPQFALNRFLYQWVGGPWEWTDKLSWSDEQWRELVENPAHRTWVAYRRGAIAGYYELYRPDERNVEILYFGLTPDFYGQGLGGPLLSHAVASAWSWRETERVWLHTCNLDHPAALANYKARGFELYHEVASAQ